MALQRYILGESREIYLCDDALQVLEELKLDAGKDAKIRQMLAKIEYLFQRFAATGSLSNDEQFKHEGDGF